jgi:tetratricopeptide (TPR) repeat protein
LSRTTHLSQKDTILLADFVNSTGDTVFDGTLKQALGVQLRQSPFLNLFPEEGVAETLRLMARKPSDRIIRDVAREICQRNGLKAFVVGSIASLGSSYVVTVEAIATQTGDVIASQQVEAAGKELVLKSVQQGVTALRRQLGESLATVRQFNPPIEQATTPSLQALAAYSKGLEQTYRGNSRDALALFNRAVEIDPDFASAYGWLSWTYANLSDRSNAAVFATKAFALRDRATELERLHISDLYYIWGTADWARQYEVGQQLKRLYPNDWMSYNDLSVSYFRLGQATRALAEAEQGITRNPNEVHLYWHASNAYIRLGRYDDARRLLDAGRKHSLDHPWYRANLLTIAIARDDSTRARSLLDSIRVADGDATALGLEAGWAASRGQWRRAQSLYQRQAALKAMPDSPPATGRNIAVALLAPLFEPCRVVADDSDLVATTRLGGPRLPVLLPIAPDGSLCGDSVRAEQFADEQVRRYPRSIIMSVYSRPVIRAMVALERNQPAKAIDVLRATIPYDTGGSFWPNYLRGQAFLRLRESADAIREFKTITDNRGWDPVSPLYALAHVGLARAYAMVADNTRSRASYEAFFRLWATADANIPVLVDARRDYAALR